MKTPRRTRKSKPANDLTALAAPETDSNPLNSPAKPQASCLPADVPHGTLEAFARAPGDWSRPAGHTARAIEHKPNSAKYRPELAGVPVEEVVRLCKVDASTARRWKRGTIAPPETALMVLRIKAHGELDDLGPEWVQWRYKDGTFWSPDKWRINRNDALSVPLLHGQVSALRGEVAALREELANGELALEEQPTPDQWQVEVA